MFATECPMAGVEAAAQDAFETGAIIAWLFEKPQDEAEFRQRLIAGTVSSLPGCLGVYYPVARGARPVPARRKRTRKPC